MNWKEYFDLKEQRKKHLKIIFLVLIALSLLQIKDEVKDLGALCGNINATCLDLVDDVLINESSGDSVEELNDNSAELDVTSQEAEKTYIDYLWFDCDFNCNEPTTSTQISLWMYRATYTPLFLVRNLIFAYVLAMTIYLYKLFKLEHKGEEGSEEKEDSKDEKKEKK